MSLPRWQEPNLARAPFVNERPVRRLAVTLWVLFAIVGGLGAWQSKSSRQETGSRIAELVRLNNETASARERAAGLERDLRRANLPAQNERTEFLNRRLAERAFSWSNLLESLTQAMPRGVRLVTLSPEEFASERLRAGAKVKVAATTRVAMRITGEAEETEDLLEFIDRLFQHPAFERPNLARESEKKDLKIQFQLAVSYLPEVAGRLAAGTLAEGTRVGAAQGPTAAPAVAPASSAAAPSPAGAATAAARAAAGRVPAPGPTAPATPAGSVAATGGKQPAARSGANAAVPSADRNQEAREAREARGARGARAAKDAAESNTGGREAEALPDGGSDPSGVPATPAPGRGGSGPRPGATAPAAPGARFPENIMPTPLRPYASSTGGGG